MASWSPCHHGRIDPDGRRHKKSGAYEKDGGDGLVLVPDGLV